MKIGVDLGGTKTEVAVLDDAGAFRLRRRVPTPAGDYDATIATIVALVNEAERIAGAHCSVGIGIPGAISPVDGRVKNANSSWLNGRLLHQDLEAALARPVRIQNDANCLAVSEAVDGAAAGARCVLGLILGTGVGAGLCFDGSAHVGRNAIAGEWGHNPLPPAGHARQELPDWVAAEAPGPDCWCGRRGCIETWLSGPALAADYRRNRAPGSNHHAAAEGPPDKAAPDAATVFRLAESGDAGAAAAVERWLDRLARSLAGLVNILDPDVIVVGGGLSNAACLYRELPRRWDRHVFSDRVDTPLVAARHGDSSGVRGAAWLWSGMPARR